MRKTLLLASSIAVVIFSGCGSKQYYKPEQTFSASSSTMGDSIVHYSRDGATLASGKVLTEHQAVKIELDKGFYFINHSVNAAITADNQGHCHLVSSKGKVASINFPQAVVGATIVGQYMVYVLQNNNFGVYDFATNAIVYNNKSEQAFSIDARIANPLQIDNLVVIPTLDGKLVILDLTTLKIAKEMYVSTEKTLNNIIFLGRLNNTLVASTPNKVLTVNNQGKKELDTAVSDVIIDRNAIFVFAKDGRIIQLDESLSVIAEKKFKFAHFSVATIYNDKVYALDKQGFLIVSNKSFSHHKVYKIDEIKGYTFVSDGTLYYNDDILKLGDLSYE